MKARFGGIRLAGFRAAVPTQRHSYVETPDPFTEDEAQKLFASTGIHSRRILPPHLCASDMCLYAAQGLLRQLDWDPASVGVLVFVSQDPDYDVPATACLLQRQLGLPTGAAAFDVNLGCSGFVYGLWIASRLLADSDMTRALVLCGDTSSRHLVPGDRATLPLFGDAGGVVALELDAAAAPMHAIFGTDGRGAPHIAVRAGRRRTPLIPTGQPRPAAEEARLFTDSRLHLNGAEVFTFSLKAVPPLVKETLAFAGRTPDDIDHAVFHQANRFMLDHLRKKTGFAEDRFVLDLHDFGNTSSASIPLAICHRLTDSLAAGTRRLLLCGFGVGWSWGALVAEAGPIPPPEVVELPDDLAPMAL